jgi:heat shock protein HslJ
MKKLLATLLRCGTLSLLIGSVIGSTPALVQAAEKPVPLTATIHFDAARKTLSGTQWKLISPTFEGAAQTPFLNFSDSSIGAGVGLNAVGGEYSTDGQKISFRNLLSTQMAGPPELMKAEDRFLKALSGVRRYEVINNGQTLILRGGETLTFRLKARTPQGFIPTATKIINVAPQLGPQMDGDKTPQYLQLEDLSSDVSWGRFTEQKIEDFQFEPGYRYQLRVQVERNPRTHEQRLRLLEIFSQQWMKNSPLKANEKILEVAPAKVHCVGVGQMQCLQVREVGGEWKAMHAPIEGFDFHSGWRYRLQIAVTPIKNPPADASDLRYTLVRLLDKMPVIY